MEDQRRLSLSARRGSRLSFRQRFFSTSSTTSSSSLSDSDAHRQPRHYHEKDYFSSGASSPCDTNAPTSPITPYVPRHAAADFARMPVPSAPSPASGADNRRPGSGSGSREDGIRRSSIVQMLAEYIKPGTASR